MRISRILLPILTLVVGAGCNDNTGLNDWNASPDTVTLYSASRPQLSGLQSGYDFAGPRPVIVESVTTGQAFDFLVADVNGAFSLIPSGALTAQTNKAGLARVTATTLESIRSAPSDTSQFQQKAPVPVSAGDFLVVRSRRVSCLISSGSYYAKMQVLSVDATAGTLTFAFVRNPFCTNQSLVPPGS